MYSHATKGAQVSPAVVGGNAATVAVTAWVPGSTRVTVPSAVPGTHTEPAATAGTPGCGGTVTGRAATRVGGVLLARIVTSTETTLLSLPPRPTARTRRTCRPTVSPSE